MRKTKKVIDNTEKTTVQISCGLCRFTKVIEHTTTKEARDILEEHLKGSHQFTRGIDSTITKVTRKL